MKTEEIIEKYISNNKLLSREGKHIVALSGGADSVALTLLLHDMGYHIEAAHCNFHLRGAEADRDEAFVKRLCNDNGIELHIIHFDTREYAELHNVSIEMAARTLRYSYFENLRRDIGADGICVAHHRDDSVETILMNLVRGTGINGLTGIKPRNGNIVRPLLAIGREDIEKYLADRHQPYVTDTTNLDPDEARRNKFRLEIIPLLKQINPSVVKNIQATANKLAECSKMADYAFHSLEGNIVSKGNDNQDIVSKGNDGIDIDIDALRLSPSPEYILFSLLRPYDFSPSQIESISERLDSANGKLELSPTHALTYSNGKIIVRRQKLPLQPMKIPEEGIYSLADGSRLRCETIICQGNPLRDISRSNDIATLDADKVSFPLMVRNAMEADRFLPFGMKGTKLVSDYLTDIKKNLLEKMCQLIITDSQGNIMWIVGERTDNRFRIDNDTKRIIRLSFSNI